MNEIVLSLSILFGIGLLSQWVSWFFKLPSVIFLLLAGLILGPITHIVDPQQTFGILFEPFIEISVIIIIFDGALGLKLKELPSIYKGLIPLLVLGPVISFALTSLFAFHVLMIPLKISLLLGAILVVTGPTVVIPLLRSSNTHTRVSNLIKWEGIINDPLAVLMTAFVFQVILVWGQGSATSAIALGVLKSIVAGAVFGLIPVYLFIYLSKRKMIPKYLNNPLLFVIVVVSSSLAESIQHGSAVLIATVQGIFIGNSSLPLVEELKNFKESITLLLLSVIFISLAAELDSSQISVEVVQKGAALFLGLLVIRLITIFVTTSKSGCSWKEKFLIAWCAPRGIVAASMAGLFAHKLTNLGIEGADNFVSLVFFIIISTVLIYGSSFKWLANKLNLTNKEAHGLLIVGASPWALDLTENLKQIDVPVALCDSNWRGLKQARLSGITTYYGDTLRMIENDSIELSEYHSILAATSNTSYNSLVCAKLSAEFGWESVFQLQPDVSDEGNPIKELPIGMSGKVLFDKRATFFNLYDLSYKGWTFRKTSITDEFNKEKLMEVSKDAIHLFHVTKNKKLIFIKHLESRNVVSGDYVLSYVPPEDKS